jgi:hypothetical protein
LAATVERLANARELRQPQERKLLGGPQAEGDIAGKRVLQKGAGAPCLRVNLWLERAIDRLPDPGRYHHLKPEYLRRHKADTGHELVDADRSFAGAARRCIARIRRRRALAAQAGEGLCA